MSAKGYFEVTDDITDLCCADMFSEVGKRTEVTTRFSTVVRLLCLLLLLLLCRPAVWLTGRCCWQVHERGSPESLRDVRGE